MNISFTDLKTYIDEISKNKVLTHNEEIDLFIALNTGSPEEKEKARYKIINSNLRFVVKIALQYSSKGLPVSDLIQEGNIGLLEVIDKFEYKKGFRFSTYAAFWIRKSIQNAIRNHGNIIKIPVRKSRLIGKIDEAFSHFFNNNGRYPSISELSSIMEVNEGKLKAVINLKKSVLSLDYVSDDDNSFSFIETIQAEDTKSPSESSMDNQVKSRVEKIINCLDEREKKILKLRFGFDSAKPLSLRKASKYVGLSQEGVRRIEKKALKKLRHPSISQYVESLL